jgi:hypothetical protein
LEFKYLLAGIATAKHAATAEGQETCKQMCFSNKYLFVESETCVFVIFYLMMLSVS